ncbi:MAG: 1-acyl-sn-glycerol-3-phosphate acyltransferase [Leptolyngbyaceae cyanobacterium MO_188.B28]|nr:1-acyl-sn-glycerol-3-phosphate acyltransferase [Leptolyngbyaceae cyanobacterium MO_188.B28]
MPQFVHRVQSRLSFIPPAYSPWLLRAVHGVLPILLRVRLWPWLLAGVTQIEIVNGAVLAELYHQFQQGNLRFLMAFRHVEVDDPLCGLYLLSRAAPQAARREGIQLRTPLHAHFLYERGMPLWAGDWLGWALSHLGGIPIRRGRHPDWPGLRKARKMISQGSWPMAVAPEGATNGHSERVGPLEPGTAQLAFWCVEDLARMGRSEAVSVVPISIQYRYVKPVWPSLGRLLTRLERNSGLPAYVGGTGAAEAKLSELRSQY